MQVKCRKYHVMLNVTLLLKSNMEVMVMTVVCLATQEVVVADISIGSYKHELKSTFKQAEVGEFSSLAELTLAGNTSVKALVGDVGGNKRLLLALIGHAIVSVAEDGVSHIIIASIGEKGHKNAIGVETRFNDPHDITSATIGQYIITDTANHCLRNINRSSTAASDFVGKCETSGKKDGGSARFTLPVGIALDRGTQLLYVIDGGTEASLRAIDMTNNYCKTLQSLPWMSMYVLSSGDSLAISYQHGILIWQRKQEVIEELMIGAENSSGSLDGYFSKAQFDAPHSFVFIDDFAFLVTDSNNDAIRNLNFNRKKADRVKQDQSEPCIINGPEAMIFIRESLYIGTVNDSIPTICVANITATYNQQMLILLIVVSSMIIFWTVFLSVCALRYSTKSRSWSPDN